MRWGFEQKLVAALVVTCFMVVEMGISFVGSTEKASSRMNLFAKFPFLPPKRRVHGGSAYRTNGTDTIIWVAGVINNDYRYWDKVKDNLEKLEKLFLPRKTWFVIYENDSVDGTRQNLTSWVINNTESRIVIIERGMRQNPEMRVREIILAYARNQVFDMIRSHADFVAGQQILVVDLDVTFASLTDSMALSLLETVEHPPFDVTCANNQGNYYDRWALRTDANYENCWDPDLLTCFQNLSAWFPDLEMNHTIPPDSPLLPVRSCFGGMALYSSQVAEGCRYFEQPVTLVKECEHVRFHDCMRAKHNATIGIKPAWLTAGHSGKLNGEGKLL
eukprot:gb/GEZN01007869.1/.p1 GENE.gb/GEZN01007869.1/~~gb/GEZN01007869.1/.p1  ORF type:complete len:332 (+),score=21.40 gb/GEZN01007869.1/:463-1458(+)